jgi:shikimate dehydrogenase
MSLKLGLIGKKLSHSYSKLLFERKFQIEHIEGSYDLLEFDSEALVADFLISKSKHYHGLNVTIPYKSFVCEFCNELDEAANEIKVVNTLLIHSKGIKGFNTDAIAFRQTIKPLLRPNHHRALILGSGSSSRSVKYVLEAIGIDCKVVSRNTIPNGLTYAELNEFVIAHHHLIVNTSPVGMFPLVDAKPEIPYEHLTPQHLVYDLVYNPAPSEFLKEVQKYGAQIKDGLDMLSVQAEEAWKIWKYYKTS